MKILLIGLGRFGSSIAERLLEQNHQLLVIENDPSTVETFLNSLKRKKLDDRNLKVCVGDATSLIVWEYLNLSEFELIISSLRGGDFNKTVCEIVRDIYKNYEIPIVVLSFDTSYERVFANYNCDLLVLPQMVATFVESFTLKNIRKPIGIGLGKNEILEAVVSPRSPYTRVPIYPHRLRHWRLGLIYRSGRIILPRRRVVLKPEDRVLLLGDDPKVVLEVAKAMALGEPQFPLSFGENMLIALKREELHYLKEYHYLWKHSRVKTVYLFTERVSPSEIENLVGEKSFLNSLVMEPFRGYSSIFGRELQNRLSAGIVSAPHRRRWLFFHNYRLKELFEQETPFLVPRLSFPYRRILVSLNTENPQGMVEQVFEIFLLTGGESLTFLSVNLPDILLPSQEREKMEKTFNLVEEYAKLYRVRDRVKLITAEGNPKKETLKLLKEHDLLIVGYTPKGIGLLEPYTPYILTKVSPKSVLGIPTARGEEV